MLQEQPSWAGGQSCTLTDHLHPTHPPCLQELSDSCRTGAATNVIFGLALGYKSAIVPCLVIATCIFVSFTLAHMFGIACAALGFLTTLSTGELVFITKVFEDPCSPEVSVWPTCTFLLGTLEAAL